MTGISVVVPTDVMEEAEIPVRNGINPDIFPNNRAIDGVKFPEIGGFG
jgi:hypothetical protein